MEILIMIIVYCISTILFMIGILACAAVPIVLIILIVKTKSSKYKVNKIEYTTHTIPRNIENNLNQSQFARKIGVKPSQVSEWLNGKSKPGYDNLKAICESIGISGDFLLGLDIN